MTIYVFDMDGTLTPARLPMEKAFAAKFHQWQQTHKSFIATGSDYLKVEEQLPDFIINSFTGLFTSMGNVLTAQGQQIYQNNFKPDLELLARLEAYRQNTAYTGGLYPNYIEERIGMINFSVLGRDCPYAEREKYAAWDKTAHERETIAAALRKEFPQYEISVGGSISIDITPQGCGKGQIAAKLRQHYPDDKIIFFGDKTFAGGNDFELAEALRRLDNTEIVQVSGPDEVAAYLQLQA
ncbi:MAG: HAD-IIB family hydrolase [Alphaproteobacteria bacterium]|nr:HAD-IIB family hydrolase [Alphaproteobacteria bacterium]